MSRTYVLSDEHGLTIGGRYISDYPLAAAKKARTQLGGLGDKVIYIRETKTNTVRKYLTHRRRLPEDQWGPFGQKYGVSAKYMGLIHIDR